MFTIAIFAFIYTLIILWWAREYGRPGWRGVTRRKMKYLGWGKAEVSKLNDPQYAEGREALYKGALFLGALVLMLISWVWLVLFVVSSWE